MADGESLGIPTWLQGPITGLQTLGQQLQQPVATKGGTIPGRAGQVMGAPQVPMVPGATLGGMSQAQQAGALAPLMRQAGGVPGGGLGSPGGLPPLGKPQFVSTAMPQLPSVTGPTYKRGESVAAGVTNFVSGMYNAVQARKQQNEQKQFQKAENLYSQMQQYQQMMASGDPSQMQQGKQQMDALLEDPKNLKIMDESLGTTFGAGTEQQDQKQTPASAGAASFVRKFAHRLGQQFDARTQAQQMGPQAQLPPPNTTGGVRMPYATPSAEQMAMAQLMQDPQKAREIAEIQAKLRPTAAEQARIDIMKEQARMMGQIRAQTLSDKVRASAQKYDVNPDALATIEDQIRQGIIKTPGQIQPSQYRAPALADMRGETIRRPLTGIPQQMRINIDEANDLVAGGTDALNNLISKYPQLKADMPEGAGPLGQAWETLKHLGMTRGEWAIYSAGAKGDPNWESAIQYAAGIQAFGSAALLRMSGSRSMSYLNLIKQHMPDPTKDTPALMLSKIQWMDTNVFKKGSAILDKMEFVKFGDPTQPPMEWPGVETTGAPGGTQDQNLPAIPNVIQNPARPSTGGVDFDYSTPQ